MFKRTASFKVNKKGRTVVAAMLAAQMALAPALGAVAPNVALGRDATLTIRNVTTNGTGFIAYKLFDADIDYVQMTNTPSTVEDVASNLAWGPGFLGDAGDGKTNRDTVLAFLEEAGYKQWFVDEDIVANTSHVDYALMSDPHNAAEFIAKKITTTGSLAAEDGHDGIDDYLSTVYGGNTTPVPNKSKGKLNAGTGDVTKSDTQEYVRKIWSRNGDSFALGLAQTLNRTTASTTAAVQGGVGSEDTFTLTGDDGYYLVMTTKSGVIDTSEAGTAPIWVALGGHTTEITEKSAVGITFSKDVAEDKNISKVDDVSVVWGKTADANTGQNLWYRLAGTLPANIRSFEEFQYKFTDTLPAGMDLEGKWNDETHAVSEGVRVYLYKPTLDEGAITTSAKSIMDAHLNSTQYVAGATLDPAANVVDITSKATITYNNHVLDVDITNLLDGKDVTGVGRDCMVAVYYQAHLTPAATGTVYGQDGSTGATKVGNQNATTLTYSADPITKTTTTVTDQQKTQTYSYQLEVTKRDKVNGKPLANAEYTVQVADYSDDATPNGGTTTAGSNVRANSDKASKLKYVAKDGSLGDARPTEASSGKTGSALLALQEAWDDDFVHKTDNQGQFLIQGLDEGTYIIKETKVPDGNSAFVYKMQDDDIVLELDSEFENNELKNISAVSRYGEREGGLGGKMNSRLGTYNYDGKVHTTIDGTVTYNTTTKAWVTDESASAAKYAPTVGNGKIELMTADDRSVVLPITGMTGPQAAIVAGSLLIVVSAVGAAIVNRRRNSAR